MIANQKLIANDGKEVMLFPLPYMYISQPEGGSYSHAGTLQIDFLGWDANGRVYNCPYYAPCTCRCVATTDASTNNRVYQSTSEVHLADGTTGYVTFEMAHDNFPAHGVGEIIQQGALLGHTGTATGVGDHMHFQCARGTYAGWTQNQYGNWMLVNEMHIYDACYVNDTVIVDGENYNWRTYDGPIEPTEEKKKHEFKWVLYARKFREGR